MNRSRSHFVVNSPVLALVLVAFGVLAWQTSAGRWAAPESPAVIATVDLERVFEFLDKRADADRNLQNKAVALDAEKERRVNEIDQLRNDLKALAEGSDRHQELMDQLAFKTIEYEAWFEFELKRLDREKGIIKADIYRAVKEALRSFAEENHYDLVLLNDSLKEVPGGPDSAVTQQISARRMLYANPAIDITDDLIARMNNAWRASGTQGG
jgi:Skp family chaperone for outer membrane proteins